MTDTKRKWGSRISTPTNNNNTHTHTHTHTNNCRSNSRPCTICFGYCSIPVLEWMEPMTQQRLGEYEEQQTTPANSNNNSNTPTHTNNGSHTVVVPGRSHYCITLFAYSSIIRCMYLSDRGNESVRTVSHGMAGLG